MRDFVLGIVAGIYLAWFVVSLVMAWGTYTERFALVVF
jgi:uncharacterized membrane protein YccC